MSTLPDLLRYQIASAAWANRRILTSAADLTSEELNHDFKTSDHSILATLTHVYRAERMWLARIKGAPAVFKADGDDTLEALQNHWPAISGDWLSWSDSITADLAVSEITYRDLKDNPWTHPLWKIVLHVVNHSTHHRGQVAGFIRALGHQPPNTDSIGYARQLK